MAYPNGRSHHAQMFEGEFEVIDTIGLTDIEIDYYFNNGDRNPE